MSPTRVTVDDDEQQLADLEADLRRLRSRLATTAVTGTHDEFIAAATPSTTYTLTYIPLSGTCLMALNGHVQREGVDYSVAYDTGVVTVSATQASGDKITFRYLVTDWLIARSLAPEQGQSLYSVAGFALNANYVYDLDVGTWATKTALPNVPATRHQFAIGAIGGKVYVTGGTTTTSGTYVYDPTADTWTALTAATTVVESAGYAVLSGKLYLIGGATAGTGTRVTTVQVYDPGTDSWSTVAALPVTRLSVVAGTISGKIYAASGITGSGTISGVTHVYDPATNTWTAKATKTTAVTNACGAAVAGKLYVVGGATNLSGTVTLTANVEAYDPSSNTWSSVAAYPLGASDFHAACEYNGKLYVSGGTTTNTSGGAVPNLYVFDPATGNWTRLTDMAAAKYGHGMVSA